MLRPGKKPTASMPLLAFDFELFFWGANIPIRDTALYLRKLLISNRVDFLYTAEQVARYRAMTRGFALPHTADILVRDYREVDSYSSICRPEHLLVRFDFDSRFKQAISSERVTRFQDPLSFAQFLKDEFKVLSL